MVVRMPSLTPLLVVRDARSALAFYVETLGARELSVEEKQRRRDELLARIRAGGR